MSRGYVEIPMLIAQAQLHQLTVVTQDPRFPLYGVPILWT